MAIADYLSTATPCSRVGLGLAAVGRPAYINVGHDHDLPPERSVAALRDRAVTLLDAAYASGVRYFDVARSYGRAEEFLAHWLARRPDVNDVIVGSKWGYTYTAGWQVDVAVHEVKDHSFETLDRQLAETLTLLGAHLSIYHVHSVTPDSSVLSDGALHRWLSVLAADGVTVGFSTSGPRQADVIRRALEITVDGVQLFGSVQSTWNLLEPSAGDALAEARDAGCVVIIKEALANGRLAASEAAGPAIGLTEVADELGTTRDAVALAAALQQPWATVVLSGAATTAQLASNLAAASLAPSPDQVGRLAPLAEPAEQYWRTRSNLRWT
jgi:aryl-alcohol dehydrogenase-like predicted oxidoreductase